MHAAELHIWFSAEALLMIQQNLVPVSCCYLHEFNMTERRAEQQDYLLPVKTRCVGTNGEGDGKELRVAGATKTLILSVHQKLLT